LERVILGSGRKVFEVIHRIAKEVVIAEIKVAKRGKVINAVAFSEAF
jgi:hypothetical protein